MTLREARSTLESDFTHPGSLIALNLLAIDTSTNRAALALARDDVRIESHPETGGRPGRELLPAIARLLESAHLSPKNLDAIAVGLGPGSYTGLRVGITAAKSLAYALNKPLIGIDTLEVIAQNAAKEVNEVIVVLDAQREAVYAAKFARQQTDSPLLRVGPTEIESLVPWAANLSPKGMILGPNLERLVVTWPDSVRLGTPEEGHPSAMALVDRAYVAFLDGRFVDPLRIEPVYLQRSAAEVQWDRR